MESITDKLIGWATNNGYWAQSLLNACFTNGEISGDKLNEIFNNYKSQDFPNIKLIATRDDNVHKTFLKSIKNIKNVNKLLDNQEMKFNDNLSIIYGANGAGKTGYVRIIKSMGNSLDDENVIYSDLTETEKENHTADIKFFNGTEDEEFLWNNIEPIQLNIKVFNSNCVRFSLNSKKDIQFIPQDFNYFNLINVATGELSRLAKEHIKKLQSDMKMYAIIDDTKVAKLLNKCDKVDNVETLVNEFISENSLEINSLKNQIEELNKRSKELTSDSIENKIKSILKIKSKLEELNQYVFIKSNLYNLKFWDDYKNELDTIFRLLSNNVKIEDFVENLNMQEKQKQLFKEFLLAADDFLKSKDNINFEDEKICLFCGQELEGKSKELLKSYSKFITNDNTKQIKKLSSSITATCKKINDVISRIKQLIPLLETDENIYNKILDLINNLSWLSNINYTEELDTEMFNQYSSFEEFKIQINTTIKDYELSLKKCEKLKNALDEAISNNRKELNELNSIAILLENKDKIVKNIVEQKNIYPLTKISNSSLSAIQSNILTTKYKEKFNQILNNQLEILEAPKNIKFSPNIVSSKLALQQSFLDKKYNLGNILSEGEQKVIALSHFIAENLMEDKDNILVFDDPVNSLDLERMEIVARALVNLSLKKQIIIFTHNLVFVGFLASFAKEKLSDEERTFICIETATINGKHFTGQIKYEFPNVESYKNYKKLVNDIMSNANENSLGKDKIYECFSYMRSAIELLVVEKVFKGTVNRYEPDIKMGRFEEINTEALNNNASRISSLHNKICRFILAHSSSAQARIEPTFDILSECYKEFKDLDTIFRI